MYKSYRMIDGEARWVIVDENGKIINKNPIKEELRSLQIEFKRCGNKKCGNPSTGYYNDTNTCDRCREENRETKLVPGKAHQEYDKDGKPTGRWICKSCYDKDYKKYERAIANRRTGNLILDSPEEKGVLFEELTCRWRGVRNLNIDNDNYRFPIDHSTDSELGIIQTKGKIYDTIGRYWMIGSLGREWHKEFDNLILYCASEDKKKIERIYIFPWDEIVKRKTIAIVKYDSRGKFYTNGWYEKYRVKDEDTLKIVNEIWRDIIKREEQKRKKLKKYEIYGYAKSGMDRSHAFVPISTV